MRKLLSIITLALLLSTAVIGSSSAATDSLSANELEMSQSFREIFGLEQSAEHIMKAYEEKEMNESVRRYGVPLKDSELKELLRRDESANKASDIRKDVINKRYSTLFSGLYLDNKDGGTLKIGIVDLDKNSEISTLIRNEFTDADKVTFFNTSVSIDELKKLQSELNQLYPSVPVKYTSISIPDNKVIVGLLNEDEQWATKIKEMSPHIKIEVSSGVEEHDAARNTYTRPLQYGLDIGVCTGSFSAKKWGSGGSPDTYYYLTAAHCGNTGSSWSQGGTSIGTMQLRNYGGNTDAAAIQVSKASTGYKAYEICTTCVPQRNNELATVRVSPSDDVVGKSVCQSGKVSGYRCGTITDVSFSPNNWAGTGVNFTNLRKANFYSTNGDSGGPVTNWPGGSYLIYEDRAVGIYKGYTSVGGTFSESVFSAIGYVYLDLGINQIYTRNVSNW